MRRPLVVAAAAVAAAGAVAAYVAFWRTPGPKPLTPIAPSQRMKATLSVPDLGNDNHHAVMAEIRVPPNYYMAMWGNEVTFTRRKTDPEISVRSLATSDGQPSPAPFIDHACGGIPNGRLIRAEDAKDGWSIVCEGELPHMPTTVVVRDLRSLGNEVQCSVTFSDHDLWKGDGPDLTAPSDHGKPSSSRVNDALAICASVTLRPIREDEFHEHWNGHEWVTSSSL